VRYVTLYQFHPWLVVGRTEHDRTLFLHHGFQGIEIAQRLITHGVLLYRVLVFGCDDGETGPCVKAHYTA
jgi:hypothetical protein